MSKEIRDEFRELFRDRQVRATTVFSIPLPIIVSLLLLFTGNRVVLKFALYIYVFILIVLHARYILVAKKTSSFENFLTGRAEEKILDRYPHLRPFAYVSLILSISVTLILVVVPPLNRPVLELIKGTPTLTPTQTLTITPSSTNTPSPTPRPVYDYLHYMIVLDASSTMTESFHGQSKWTAAVNLVTQIINGLNPNAHYGLVLVGGSDSAGSIDPCQKPSSSAVAFSTSGKVWNSLENLQPRSGGSFYKAFTLAKAQLESLPPDDIRTMIYVTGSSDSCSVEDEWVALKNLLDVPDTTVGLYSQIIILDNDGLKSRTLAEQFNSLSENVNVQAPQNIQDVQGGGVTIINVTNNVNVYVNTRIETLPTEIPRPPTSIVIGTINPTVPTGTASALPPTPMAAPPTAISPTEIPPTKIPPTNTIVPIQWEFTSPDGRYGVKKTYFSAVDAHYQVFNTSTNELIFTTNAKYLYPSENDVKAGAFSSDSTRFAAAYHYREDRDYTWVRVWNAQTGGVLYDLEIDGWTTDLSGVFN